MASKILPEGRYKARISNIEIVKSGKAEPWVKLELTIKEGTMWCQLRGEFNSHEPKEEQKTTTNK